MKHWKQVPVIYEPRDSVLKFHVFTEIDYFSVHSLKPIHNTSLNPEYIIFAAIKLQSKT